MIPADYHVHTTFCDGSDSPEAMVKAAIAKGLTDIGFSGHSHTAFDESWCMSAEGTGEYRAEIQRLRSTYAGQIRVLCGVEQDYYSDADTDGYDYVIGSVHYLLLGGEYVPVDETAEDLLIAAKRYCGGDIYALCEAYYDTLADVVRKTNCDIIGHFDLIEKFNEGGKLFNSQHPRYMAAWQAAADQLLKSEKTFEINTGAIARGYRTVPYPTLEIQEFLARRCAKFILSGDAHCAGGLCFQFDRWERK